MDWVALFSTPAAVAAFTGAVSVVTLWLANHHADRLSTRQMRERQGQLEFEAQERRYEDRRDAVIELDRAADRETCMIEDSEQDPQTGYSSPAEIYPDYRFPELVAAHARVVMLATPEVVAAANELQASVVAAFHGEKGHWSRYQTALEVYRTEGRAMLANERQIGGPPR